MWEVIDAGKFRNIENEAGVGELAHFIRVKVFPIETAAKLLEAIKVGGVKLLKSTYKCLHVEFSIDFAVAEVCKTNFDFITKFGGFLFGSTNLGLGAFG